MPPIYSHPAEALFIQPILLLALEDYFSEPTPTVLKRMYEAINSIDIALAPHLSLDERMVLRCSERKDLFEEKFTKEYSSSPTDTISNSRETAKSINRTEQPYHLGVPDGDSELPPRLRIASDNSTASAPNMARNNSNKFTTPNSAKSRSLRDTHYFETSVNYNDLSLPIRLPLYTFPHEVGDVCRHRVQT